VDAFYVAAAMRTDRLAFVLPLMRVVMAFGVLIVPTFMMGATLPLLTKALVRRDAQFGARLSWLYGSNTLGAVIGTLGAGFVLIPALGVWRAQLSAVGVNLLIGMIAVGVDRRSKDVEDDEEQTEVSDRPVSARAVGLADRPVLQLAFWGTAVSGFCALALEVMWTRALSIAVGGTVYSFTVMLAAFLTGIWVGSWLHALFPLRRVHEAVQFALVLLFAGGFSLAASFWIPRLPELAIRLNQGMYADLTRIRPGTAMLLAFLVMLVPCVFIGVAFPLANQARARLSEGYGRPVGDTLGLNTLGSIGGSLAAGFVLIPALGLQRGMLLASALYLAYGAVVLGAMGLSRLPRWRWATVVATTTLVACALSLPSVARPWSVATLGGFINNSLPTYVDSEGQVDFQTGIEMGTVRYYREGRVATISVREANGHRSLIVNGKIVASDSPGDMHNLLMLGHVPVLMHADPKSALVIGLGAGVTLGAVAAHESLDDLILAEIEPAVLGAARLFEAANGNPLEDPRLHIHLEDGRNFLKTTTRRFDVITADPIHPWTRGSGYLFTTEYYRLAAERLAEDGIMCQ
jgi:spermidine synthase